MSGRLTYIGHATVLIEQAGGRLLTDPLLHGGIAHMRRRVPRPQLDRLRDLDAVLISHAHADHLDVKSLRMLEHAGTVIAPRDCAGILRRAGMQDIVGLTAGERCEIGGIAIEAVRAEHDGRRHPFGRELGAIGFLVDGPARIYFAGDTDLFDGMAALAGRVDVALLPIWGWGPRLPPGHLNPETAARAVALIAPQVVVPIHWGTMRSVGARGADDPYAPARAFTNAVAAAAPATEVRVLSPGDTTTLPSPDSGDAIGEARP